MEIVPVLIVSRQTLFNVLFLKECLLKGMPIKHCIFITTKEMRRDDRSSWILKAAGLEGKVKKQGITVTAENYFDSLQALRDKLTLSEDKEYYVNLTGGTKMMAMATQDYFKEANNVSCFYMPVNENAILKIYPQAERRVNIDTQLNLEEYLAAYGYEIEEKGFLDKEASFTKKIFHRVHKSQNAKHIPEVEKALKEGSSDKYKPYWTGGWFEEYVYSTLKESLGLGIDSIAFNVKLKFTESKNQGKSDSEIDVLFVFNNQLYIIECKVYTTENLKGNAIFNPMYKLGSIQKTLGLSAHCYLFLANPLGDIEGRRDRIELLKKLLNIRDVLELKQLKALDTYFKK